MIALGHHLLWPLVVFLVLYLVQTVRQRVAIERSLVGEINLLLRKSGDFMSYLSQTSHDWLKEGASLASAPYFRRSDCKVYAAALANLHLLRKVEARKVVGFYDRFEKCESEIEILYEGLHRQEQSERLITTFQVEQTVKRTNQILHSLNGVLTRSSGKIQRLCDLPSEFASDAARSPLEDVVDGTRKLRFLYPSDPARPRMPAGDFEDECAEVRAAGFACSLFSVEELESGRFQAVPPLSGDEIVIYRGWMMKPEAYAALYSAIGEAGCKALTSGDQYRLCHWLPEWYSLCEEATPKTYFFARNADFAALLPALGWSTYFVKDYVKSLTTSRGSVAKTPEEVDEILAQIEQCRGEVEGGVCIRRFETLKPESEERYFVFGGKVFGRDGGVPDLVERIASRIDSPFFSVDIALNVDGEPRLIELGDGQVSDRKGWTASRFVEIFRG